MRGENLNVGGGTELQEEGGTGRTAVTIGRAWRSSDSGTSAASVYLRCAVVVTSMTPSEASSEWMWRRVSRSADNVVRWIVGSSIRRETSVMRASRSETLLVNSVRRAFNSRRRAFAIGCR